MKPKVGPDLRGLRLIGENVSVSDYRHEPKVGPDLRGLRLFVYILS